MVDPPTPGQRRRFTGYDAKYGPFTVMLLDGDYVVVKFDDTPGPWFTNGYSAYRISELEMTTEVVPVLPPLPEPTWSNVYRTGMSYPRATAELATEMASSDRIGLIRWTPGYVDTEGNDLP